MHLFTLRQLSAERAARKCGLIANPSAKPERRYDAELVMAQRENTNNGK